MGRLDSPFGPPERNRFVTCEYLEELYAQVDRARQLEQYLAALQADPDFRCSIGGIDEWLQSSDSPRSSRLGLTTSGAGHAATRTSPPWSGGDRET